MVQLQLLDLMISRECGAVPMDAATRADLIEPSLRIPGIIISLIFSEQGKLVLRATPLQN
jgi:hypothetical protein